MCQNFEHEIAAVPMKLLWLLHPGVKKVTRGYGYVTKWKTFLVDNQTALDRFAVVVYSYI